MMLFSLTEQLITPEQFAEIMCGDLDLNPTLFTSAIAQTIRQQAEAYTTENLLEEQTDQRVILKVRMFSLHIRCMVLTFKGFPFERILINCFKYFLRCEKCIPVYLILKLLRNLYK